MEMETQRLTKTEKKKRKIRRTINLIENFDAQKEEVSANKIRKVKHTHAQKFLPQIDDLMLPDSNECLLKINMNPRVDIKRHQIKTSSLDDSNSCHRRKLSSTPNKVDVLKMYNKAYVRLERLNIDHLLVKQNQRMIGIKPECFSMYIKQCQVNIERFNVNPYLMDIGDNSATEQSCDHYLSNHEQVSKEDYKPKHQEEKTLHLFKTSSPISSPTEPGSPSLSYDDLSNISNIQDKIDHITISDDSASEAISTINAFCTSSVPCTPIRKSALKGTSNSISKNLKVTFNETSILIISDGEMPFDSPLRLKGTPIPTLFSRDEDPAPNPKGLYTKKSVNSEENAVLLDCDKLNYSAQDEHSNDNKSEPETNSDTKLPKMQGRGTINQKNGFNRFGFKNKETFKLIQEKVEHSKPVTIKAKENKIIKVKTNKRFELLMKMRKEKQQ